MRQTTRTLLFAMFFVSGFCGLLYQVVWTRLAFAAFGIITPVLSVSISVFMLGLSIGSWMGGRWIRKVSSRTGLSAIGFYGIAELLIGCGAIAVPALFDAGSRWLLLAGEAGSTRYLVYSAGVLVISLLPWCILLGATMPVMLAFIRERDPANSQGFSYLYFANVLGGVAGTVITAFVLIESLGFRHTLWVAAVGNVCVAAASVLLGLKFRFRAASSAGSAKSVGHGTDSVLNPAATGKVIYAVLFTTGFVSMGMEVVWTRAFTPVVKTQVYSFAAVLATYLIATAVGSWIYRRRLGRSPAYPLGGILAFLASAALLPILINDPRLIKANWQYTPDAASMALVLCSIVPFCGVLGYLTPKLVDDYAGGDPNAAGKAYATNVLGCILGPLFAGYLLLPNCTERTGLLLLSLPLLLVAMIGLRLATPRIRLVGIAVPAAVFAVAALVSTDYEARMIKTEAHTVTHRDYAASVLCYGQGMEKLLCVNGIGMTTLTPMTKFMVHLPLAYHRGKPASALIICFGMGTSYRSAMSWGIDVTAVELVPGVVKSFGFFHTNTAPLLANPKGKIVVDDGRRFLKRTREKFDVIVIDPPPPMEAAGSSLLYSREFYELAKAHLNTNGILQAWYPGTEDRRAASAMFRAIHDSFPYVFCADGVDGWGTHFLASMSPLDPLTGEQLARRLPSAATADLLEWASTTNAAPYLDAVVSKGVSIERLLNPDPGITITDDHPLNEYFMLRQLGWL